MLTGLFRAHLLLYYTLQDSLLSDGPVYSELGPPSSAINQEMPHGHAHRHLMVATLPVVKN